MSATKEVPQTIKNLNFSDLPESVRRQIDLENAYLGIYTKKSTGKTYMRLLIKNEDGKYFDYRNGGSPSEKQQWKSEEEWKQSLGLDQDKYAIEVRKLGEATLVKKDQKAEKEFWFENGGLSPKKKDIKQPYWITGGNLDLQEPVKKGSGGWTLPDWWGAIKAGAAETGIQIGLSDPRASLDALKRSPTFENLKDYATQLENARGKVSPEFYEEAKGYMLQYLVAQRAVFDAMEQQKDEQYTTRTYGKYELGKNDCYTWFMKLYNSTYNEKFNKKKKPGNFMNESIGEHELEIEKGLSLKNVEKLYLQVGDIVMVDKSPSGTGRTHWGVAVYQDGELKIANRSNGVQLSSLDEFFRNTKGKITVARYGQPEYAQHFEVAVSRDKHSYQFDAKIVEGKSPDAFFT